jgi:hypothetical protein
MNSIKDNIKILIKSYSNIHTQGRENNIFLFATPRGGSTWMMEILTSQKGMKYFDEPFNIRRENVLRCGRFIRWEDLMPDAGNDAAIVEYIDDLSKNRIGVMNPAPFRKHYRIKTNRIVFKIHEIGHLINTIETECSGDILFLLRHPIPTSLSRKVFPRMELLLDSKVYKEKYIAPHQMLEAKKIAAKGSHVQRGALAWCIENLVPLKYSITDNWLVVTYEELLLNTTKMCQKIADCFNLSDINRMLATADQPSVNIQMSGKKTHEILEDEDIERRRKRMVTKWQDQVSETEQKQCFEVMNLFELDTYYFGSFIANDSFLHFSDTEKKLNT